MIRIIIQQLVIFLLPILLYGIYFAVQRRRANQAGQPRPRWEDGPWFWLVLGGALLSVAVFVAMGLLEEGNPDVLYVPPSGPQ